MNVGELFFQLGFKTTGIQGARQFESTVDSAKNIAEAMRASLDDVGFILGNIAIKLKAMTKDEVELVNQTRGLTRLSEDAEKQNRNANKNRKESINLIDLMRVRMTRLTDVLKSSRLAMMGVGAGLLYMMKGAGDFQVKLQTAGAVTGYSQDTISRLSRFAATAQVDIGQLMGSISELQQMWELISSGQGGDAYAYNMFGLDPSMDPIEMLSKIGRILNTMDAPRGTMLARRLGLSDDMIRVTRAYEKELTSLAKTAVKDDHVKKVNYFNGSLNRLWDQGKRIMLGFARAVEPVMRPILDMIEDFANNVLPHLIKRFGVFITDLKSMLPNMKVVGLLIAAALAPATSKIVLLVAAIEDLWSFFRGDDSLFGRFLNYMLNINGAAKDLIHLFTSIARLFGMSKETAQKFENSALQGLKSFVGGEGTTGNDYADRLSKSMREGAKSAKNMWTKFKGFWGENLTSVETDKMLRGEAVKKQVTNNNTVTINVNGAKNPHEVSDEINKKLGNLWYKLDRGEE